MHTATRTSAERAQYIRDNYFLRETGEGFEAVAMYRGAVVSRYSGPDRREVCRLARLNWGHFNFEDEARAFAEIFR